MITENRKAGDNLGGSTSFLLQQLKRQHEALLMANYTKNTPKKENQMQTLVNNSKGYGNWLTVIASNEGILTHQLEAFGLKSNNAHNMTQFVNPRIIPLGYVVAKTVHTKPNESWSWHLWPIGHALKQPISDTLRSTIVTNMEAANDE